VSIPGRSLSILVHADTKVGKSTFANTAPAPRLLLDAEAAHRFLPGRKVYWDPGRDAPPAWDGSWDTCVVRVRDYGVMTSTMAWLITGQHHFESVIVDSISEVQKKMKDQIGSDGMKLQLWGELLTHMESLIRQLRDLTEHPTKPLTAVVLTAMTEQRDGKWRPYVQGQLRVTLPYFIDVVGYAFVQDLPAPDPSQPSPGRIRRMLTRPHPLFEAGERVQSRIPEYIDGDAFNVEWMLNSVFGPVPQPTTNGQAEAVTAVAS
jgi:hypothetical protein